MKTQIKDLCSQWCFTCRDNSHMSPHYSGGFLQTGSEMFVVALVGNPESNLTSLMRDKWCVHVHAAADRTLVTNKNFLIASLLYIAKNVCVYIMCYLYFTIYYALSEYTYVCVIG